MKTIVTFLIALLAFASTLAWAGPEQSTGRGTAAQTQNQPQAREAARPAPSAAQRSPAARSAASRPAHNPAAPVANYEFDLPAGPTVLCACVVDKTLG